MKTVLVLLALATFPMSLFAQSPTYEQAILKNDTDFTVEFYSQWSDQSKASKLNRLSPGQTLTLRGNPNAQLVVKYNATPWAKATARMGQIMTSPNGFKSVFKQAGKLIVLANDTPMASATQFLQSGPGIGQRVIPLDVRNRVANIESQAKGYETRGKDYAHLARDVGRIVRKPLGIETNPAWKEMEKDAKTMAHDLRDAGRTLRGALGIRK